MSLYLWNQGRVALNVRRCSCNACLLLLYKCHHDIIGANNLWETEFIQSAGNGSWKTRLAQTKWKLSIFLGGKIKLCFHVVELKSTWLSAYIWSGLCQYRFYMSCMRVLICGRNTAYTIHNLYVCVKLADVNGPCGDSRISFVTPCAFRLLTLRGQSQPGLTKWCVNGTAAS